MYNCIICTELSVNYLCSPFHDKYVGKEDRSGEIYTTLCEECILKCRTGEITEDELRLAVAKTANTDN